MPKADIPESDIDEDLENSLNPRKRGKKCRGFIDRHVEDFSDIFSFELNPQGFTIVSHPLASITLDIDIREEVHLDLLGSTPLTDLTATTLGVE